MRVVQLLQNALDRGTDEPGPVDRIDVLLRDVIQNLLKQPGLEVEVSLLVDSTLEKPTARDEGDREHDRRSPGRSHATQLIVIGHYSTVPFSLAWPIRAFSHGPSAHPEEN